MSLDKNVCVCVCVRVAAGEPDEDELYESGIVESNGIYRVMEDKLVPYEEAWASIPSVTLLNSKEVRALHQHFHCVYIVFHAAIVSPLRFTTL